MPHNHWHNPAPGHWHHYYKRYNMFYGPSRLVWFAFGSVATWAWIRHHHDRPRVGYGYGHGNNNPCGVPQWERDQSPPPPPPATNNNLNASSSPSPSGRGDWPTQPQTQPQPPTTQSESMTPMDMDHERLRQIGRSAEETISGMSEATIDSMMGALQRLKDRLAERRGQQQLQEIGVGPQQANPTQATSSPKDPSGPRHWV